MAEPAPSTREDVPRTRERLEPVGNRGPEETPQTSREYPGGDRGAHSGVNRRDDDEASQGPEPAHRG